MTTAILVVAAVALIALGVALKSDKDDLLFYVAFLVFAVGLSVEDALLVAYLMLGVGA